MSLILPYFLLEPYTTICAYMAKETLTEGKGREILNAGNKAR